MSLLGGPWALSLRSRSKGRMLPRDLRLGVLVVKCLHLLRPAGAVPQKAEAADLPPEICLLEAFPRHHGVPRRGLALVHWALVIDARRLDHQGPRARVAVVAGHASAQVALTRVSWR